MTTIAANPPIPGDPLDPAPKEVPDLIQDMDDADHAGAVTVGVAYRALTRFNNARSTLLAAGTTYYTFLAMFSLIALAYGITAMLGTDRLAGYLTEAISEAFPGLLGAEGIDPAEMKSIGQAASVIGLIVMLYAGSGAMLATSASIHLIYGAPPNPRNFVTKRIILLGWLLIIGPVIVFSLVAGSVAFSASYQVFDALGIEGSTARLSISLASIVLTFAADFLVVYILLGKLGGIRPPTKALVVGCAIGAVGLQLLRIPMSWILGFSVDKPQYGAFAIPIGVLLVMYLNVVVVFTAAALTAGFAERDVPIEEIVPVMDIEEAQPS